MKLVKLSIEYLWSTQNTTKVVEKIGRVCYKSEINITDNSALF